MQSFLPVWNLKHTAMLLSKRNDANESTWPVQISLMVSIVFTDVKNDGDLMIIRMTITSHAARVSVIVQALLSYR